MNLARLKRKIKAFFPIRHFLAFWYRRKVKKYQHLSTQAIFSDIYQNQTWKVKDSVSGSGSDLAQTAAIRQALPDLLRRYEVKVLLDAPCGDFEWMRTLVLPIQTYWGVDIVEKLIKENQKKYGQAHRGFQVLNFVEDALPEADLVLMRDAWVHLSHQEILQTIQNLKKSNISYLLTTHFTSEAHNMDIQTGSWRPLNLCKKPFNFPPPIEMIAEQSTESKGAYWDKSLALWRISDLPLGG